MFTSQFSRLGLESVFRATDKARYPFTRMLGHRIHYLNTIALRIEEGSFGFYRLKAKSIRGFTAYRTQKLGDELVLRRLADLIRRAYRVRQPDRDAIVNQVTVLLGEPVPKSVLRLDIAAFFESVDRDQLLAKLRQDRLLSDYCVTLVSRFFLQLSKFPVRGLPRGLSISAALSEVCLLDADARIRRLAGVYYYARYVDDMVVFTTSDPNLLKHEISKILPAPIRFNETKCQSFSVDCRCRSACAHFPHECICRWKCKCKPDEAAAHCLNYVGYSLKFSDVPTGGWPALPVQISMAPRKVNRIKTRAVLALLDHVRNPNFDLLEERLAFLTGNQHLRTKESRGNLRTGIFYNYALITEHLALKELDTFLRNVMHAPTGSFASKVRASLSPVERGRLLRLSFLSGHRARRSRRVASGVMAAIRKCWKHV